MPQKQCKILYVDDEVENLDSFCLVFLKDYDVFTTHSGTRGLAILDEEAAKEDPVEIVISDQRMPEMSGIEFLEAVSKKHTDVVKILISGYSDLEVVTQAINRVGIFKYVAKPWEQHELQQTIELARQHFLLKRENQILLDDLQKVNKELASANKELTDALAEVKHLKNKLQEENIYLRQEIDLENNFKEIITQSTSFLSVLRSVENVASTPTTVLILGETGTGKELIARAIHNISDRRKYPLVKINCAALPANLIESELFGHEKGAFTGANTQKKGRFELANGGTLFLDEIGEMPLELQPKLLRVLQEGEFERLGGTKTLKVDVRLIAATNRDLEEEIAKGNFRQDLFFRLNVFPIELPALRHRKEDISLLAEHFTKKFAAKTGKKIDRIPRKTLEKLEKYRWPGNVRELENIIERAVIVSHDNKLEIGEWIQLPDENLKDDHVSVDTDTIVVSLEQNERRHIIRALKATKGVISGQDGAAVLLQINPSTLRSRMQKLGIRLGKSFSEIQ